MICTAQQVPIAISPNNENISGQNESGNDDDDGDKVVKLG
jgi:hypothetical protein